MNKEKIRKIYIFTLLVYTVCAVSFYFLTGEQLWYKESKGSTAIEEADSISDEINKNTTISQTIECHVDRIESIDMVFTKNYQDGNGKLSLLVLADDKVIGNSIVDVINIPEQSHITFKFDKPIDGYANSKITLELRASSEVGQGAHIMMKDSDSTIKVNDKEMKGTMCFSIKGLDKIFISKYYWLIMAVIEVLLAAVLFNSYKNFINHKYDYLIICIYALERYKFLISQLVSRDFKSKYKRSVFGIFWSFLNPLLTMTVQFLVFSTFFKADTQNYPVYLISGVVCFSFFNECTTMCLSSITSNYRLITKVYIPKYIFPFAKTISSTVNLGISLIPLLLVTIITGTILHWSILLMIYFLICLVIFSLGIGMILATLMVFFRDIQFLWSVFITIWQYATPIFYPAEIIPERYRFIVKFNPLYHFIGCTRKCLIDGISPEPIQYIYCLVFALGSLAIGSYIFKKCQDKFTLYL